MRTATIGGQLETRPQQRHAGLRRGAPAWNKGIPWSDEVKKKIGDKNRGRHPSAEAREKMKKSHAGFRHTPESKLKISIANSGKKKPPFSLEHRRKIGISSAGRKASLRQRELASKRWIGSKNPSWKGGIYPENRAFRDRLEYKLWREAVFERDNWTCQACGNRSCEGNHVELHAHHLKPFAVFPELRIAIDNGVTLCVSCHRKTETWGKKL